MTGRYFSAPASDDLIEAKKRKAARTGARVCGLVLAAITAGVLYGGLDRSSTQPLSHVTSPAGVKDLSLRRLGTFSTSGLLSAVQFSPDGKILVAVTAASQGSQIDSWSTSTARQVTEFPAVSDGIPADGRSYGSIAFSSDGKSFAALDYSNNGSGGEIEDIWDMATRQGEFTRLPSGPSGYPPLSVVPGPDDLLATVYENGTASVANVASGQSDVLLSDSGYAGGGPPLGMLTFSPDGRMIAAADGYGKIYLWNATSGRLHATLIAEKLYNNVWSSGLPVVSQDLGSLTFSPDGTAVACGTYSGIVRVWDAATGRSISAFSVNGDDPSGAAARPVTTLVFSPDGRMLVTTDSTDGRLGVWDVASGRNLATLTVSGGDVASVAFTPVGALLVATTRNNPADATASSAGASNNPADRRIEIWTTGKNLAAILSRS